MIQKTIVCLLAILSWGASLPAQECYSRFFSEGVAAYEDLDFETAIKKLEAARICPDKPRRSTEVEEWLDKAKNGYITEIKKARRKAQGSALAARSILALQLEDQPEKAFRLAEYALKEDPDNEEAEQMLLRSFYNQVFSWNHQFYLRFTPYYRSETRTDSIRRTLTLQDVLLGSEQWEADSLYLGLCENNPDIPIDFGGEGNFIISACYVTEAPSTGVRLLIQEFNNTFDAITRLRVISLIDAQGEATVLKWGEFQESNPFPLLDSVSGFLAIPQEDSLEVWDWRKQVKHYSLKAHPGGVKQAAFAFDGTAIATLGNDSKLRIWSRDTLVITFSVPSSLAEQVFFSSQDSLVCTTGKAGTLCRSWLANPLYAFPGRIMDSIPGTDHWVSQHAGRVKVLSGTGKELASQRGNYFGRSGNGETLLLSLHYGDSTVWWRWKDNEVTIQPQRWVGFYQGLVLEKAHFDWKGKLLREWPEMAMAVSEKGKVFVSQEEKTGIYDLSSPSAPLKVLPETSFLGWTDAIFSPDSRYLFLTGSLMEMGVWDLENIAYTSVYTDFYTVHKSDRFFTGDGKYFLVQDSPFQLSADRIVCMPLAHLDSSIAQEGLLLDLAPKDPLVLMRNYPQYNLGTLWNVATGETTLLEGHQASLAFGAFSPDGQSSTTLSEDGKLIVWKKEGEMKFSAQLPVHDPDFQIGFTPDQSHLIMSSPTASWSLPLSRSMLIHLAGKLGIPDLSEILKEKLNIRE